MATAPSLAAAARRCSPSGSALVRRVVTDTHSLTLDGCALFREVPRRVISTSEPFEAAGHRWRITWAPNGEGKKRKSWWRDGYMSFSLKLDDDAVTDPVDFKFTLLNLHGSPVHVASMGSQVFSSESRRKGFNDFVKWKDLENMRCLKDDRFTVRCDITGVKWVEAETTDGGGGARAARVVVPPSNLHEHLNDLLWKKQGTDVAIDVSGETFEAHGWLLTARSPVFEAELLAATKEKAAPGGGGGARRRMEIQGVEPKVFKAMLRFVYTDVLPEMGEENETVAMAQGLLAAAGRYKLERLKLMCEEVLFKRIEVNTVATTLVVAEEHGCHALKDACLEFLARPWNMKAVMETEGFEKMKSCLPVMVELVMKKLASIG
jgi:speckle-type POZ protein